MIETSRRVLLPLEGGLLILSTPLLMFPDINRSLTLGVTGLLVGVWLIELILARIPLLPNSPFSPAMLLWGGAVAVGVLITADPDLTYPKAMGLILGFAYWRYLATAVKSARALTWAVLFFLFTGLAMTGVGAISADWRDKVALLSRLLTLLPEQLIQLPGAGEGGTHTNELGGTIVIYLPLLFIAVIGWRPVRKRPLLILVMMSAGAIALLILLLTQSRSAWIGTAGSFMFVIAAWFYFLPPSRVKQMTKIGVAVVGLIMLVALTQVDWQRVTTFIEEPPRDTAVGTFTTINFRRQLWNAAVEVIEDTPFTGTGLGSFRRVVPRLYPISASETNDVAHAHNMFFQVAVDTGLPGLSAYLALLLTATIATYRIAQQQAEDKSLMLGLYAGIIGLHLFGMTDALAPGAKPAILFWIALGLITALYHYHPIEKKPGLR